MPLTATRDDRKLLLIAAVMLVIMLTGVAVLAPPEKEEVKYPSSYSADSGGAKAAYLLLGESGYRVERWLHKPQDLPEGPGAVLIMAEPFQFADSEERAALGRFVAKGGRIIGTGMLAGMFLPESAAKYGTAKACPT